MNVVSKHLTIGLTGVRRRLGSICHSGRVRLLIVEDDPAIAGMLERGLRAEGFQVDLSADGLDALWRASESKYSAVVLDLLIPGCNGYEVCRRLREEGNQTPVLVLTAKNGDLDEIELFDLGADDFLTKPVRFGVLVARLRALMRRSLEQATNQLEVGALMLDQQSLLFSLRGEPVDLTPRERSVLRVLMAGRGQPVSKQHVIDQVWGMDFDGEPNIVDVYLGRLRSKVGAETIETVRGVGYRVMTDA